MDFTRDDKADINGTYFLMEITAYGAKIKELFGDFPGLLQQRAKYSSSVTVRHVPTGEIYTLYMSFGRWRIGGRRETCSAIGKLAALVNPCKHGNYENMEGAEVLKRAEDELHKSLGIKT